MKNYSSNRAQKGKTAYRTPSRWKASQPEKIKRTKQQLKPWIHRDDRPYGGSRGIPIGIKTQEL